MTLRLICYTCTFSVIDEGDESSKVTNRSVFVASEQTEEVVELVELAV